MSYVWRNLRLSDVSENVQHGTNFDRWWVVVKIYEQQLSFYQLVTLVEVITRIWQSYIIISVTTKWKFYKVIL